MAKLTKYERGLVSKGRTSAANKLKTQGRARRITGTAAALIFSYADSMLGDEGPKFKLPVLGETKATTIVGGIALGNYLMSKYPSDVESAGGYVGLAAVCRAL